MVFGRKKAAVETREKPQPPNVEEILEDLREAGAEDPVFALNPSLQSENSESDIEKEVKQNYSDVTEYLNKEKKILELRRKISTGFNTLESSQKDLEKISVEVATSLENIRQDREKSQESEAEVAIPANESAESESEEDLC